MTIKLVFIIVLVFMIIVINFWVGHSELVMNRWLKIMKYGNTFVSEIEQEALKNDLFSGSQPTHDNTVLFIVCEIQ